MLDDDVPPNVYRLFDEERKKQSEAALAATGRIYDSGFWMRDAQPQLDIPYLVKGIFDRGQIVVVWGAPGSGKTFAAISLAAHIGAGVMWCGRRVRKGSVLYVCAESTRARLENRLYALGNKYPELADSQVLWCPISADLLHGQQDLVDVISAAKRLTDPALIVIDTLAVTFGGGNENGTEDMNQYVSNMKRIRQETQAAVLIVHHCGKDEAKGMRGHSSLLGALDSELVIERQGAGPRLMKAGKLREGDSFCDLFGFDLEVRVIGLDPEGDIVDTCVMVPSETKIARRPKTRVQVQVLSAIEAAYRNGERSWTEKEIRVLVMALAAPPHRNSIKSSLIALTADGFLTVAAGGYSLAMPPEMPNDPF
jgi:KaiC/GvpD/RAD55 family RecA-like ATPase